MLAQRSTPWLLSCLLLATAPAHPVHAEPPPSSEAPTRYDAAIDAALGEYDAGNFREARAHFREAHALFPNARTLYGLGTVAFELREYARAIRDLDQALASDVRPLEGTLRDEAVALRARAQKYVSRLRVQVTPATASVLVDGEPVERAMQDAVLLDLGEHVVELRAPGRAPEQRKVRAQGGERLVLHVALAPLPSTEAHQGSQAASRPLARNPWLWSAVAVVLAGAAATTVALTLPKESPAPYGGSIDAVLSGPAKR